MRHFSPFFFLFSYKLLSQFSDFFVLFQIWILCFVDEDLFCQIKWVLLQQLRTKPLQSETGVAAMHGTCTRVEKAHMMCSVLPSMSRWHVILKKTKSTTKKCEKRIKFYFVCKTLRFWVFLNCVYMDLYCYQHILLVLFVLLIWWGFCKMNCRGLGDVLGYVCWR